MANAPAYRLKVKKYNEKNVKEVLDLSRVRSKTVQLAVTFKFATNHEMTSWKIKKN
jgi:hypothetical protein